MKRILLLGILLSIDASAFVNPLYEGASYRGLSGAYTAVANDADALFFNPAGLAGIKGTSIYLGNLTMTASEDVYSIYSDSASSLSGFDASTINAFMGHNIYLRAQTVPILAMPGFALGIIADHQIGFFSHNTALPKIIMGYQTTMGLQAGMGISLTSKRVRKGKPQLRLGLAPKILWRKGGFQEISTAKILGITNYGSFTTDTFGNYGMGLGLDLGAQYLIPMSKTMTLQAGAAFLDVGGTAFSSNLSSRQESNLSLGVAAVYESGLTRMTFSYDFSNITQSFDWRRKNHLGAEFGFTFLSLYAGMNEAYLTYGAAVNLWLFKIYAISYAEELGELIQQDANRRYLLRMEVKIQL